ncbi:hypothetical protein ARMA_1732 [Ardenticatena maritima]|uniref:histidine kinase n=1 Tax=Ardenticatena maritima TaxID=872965 RepID=A0A0M8K9P3_9CHLR|nr:GAF domain-containing protein [Ardenticatena maritima]KPL87708.1 hypothetical protein SE16_08910 [Ardenticatena maritima]GAP63309.1 hypothetical protein ARMA_1732 [Ardenticatena maritima]
MTEDKRAVERLERLQSILETLVEFEETFEFEEAWERIIRDAVQLMGARRGTLFLVDRNRDLLLPRVWYGEPWTGQGRPRGYQRGEGIAGRVWLTGEPINCPDVRHDPRFRRSHDPRWAELRSLLCVPIRARERVIGVIAVDSTEENAFREEDERLLTTLARHVASAFETAKLYQGLADLRDVGERLNKMGPRTEYADTLRAIVEKAVQVVAAGASSAGEAAAVIYRYDDTRGEFDRHSRVAAGWRDFDGALDDYPRKGGLGERAILLRRRVLSYEQPDFVINPAQQQQGAAAVVAYPLIAADRVLGVLYVTLRDERRFTRHELMLLDNFVNQAALALYHTEQIGDVSRELARKVYELEQLRRADALISQRPHLDEALAEILRIAVDTTRAEYGSFRLYNRNDERLHLAATAGLLADHVVRTSLRLDEASVIGQAVKQRRPVRVDDVFSPEWKGLYRPLAADIPIRSELAIPLFNAGGGLEGVLNLESTQPYAFDEEDERLLSALATQAVIAIQEFKLIDTMAELTEATLTHTKTSLFELAIRRACELINAPYGAIWRLEQRDDGRVLVLQAASTGQRRGETIPLESSLTGKAVLQRAPITVEDVQNHAAFRNTELARRHGWRSALIVPLLARNGDPIGAFSIYTTDKRTFGDWEKRLLTVLANHAAIAIRDAEILETLRETRERQAVAETFAAVGDIAANLLHRLNNQVGTIPVRVQSIEAKCAAEIEANEYLAKNLAAIAASARDAMRTVRDTLRHLRPIEMAPVRVGDALLDALREVRVPPEVQLFTENIETLPPVRAGRPQLALVFINLIENAIEAMQGAGQITIRAHRTNDEVVIHVSDNGPGIPDALLPHIFELNVSSGGERKLGFGLWWVRTLLQRLNGHIDVFSEEGHGTTFIIRLPVWEEELAEAEA